MSNAQDGITWRILVVEDEQDNIRQLVEILPSSVDGPDQVEVMVCENFAKAAERLRTERFDLLVLDLKDDSGLILDEDVDAAGLAVFEALKKTRFMPVVFYTAFAHAVRSKVTSFVRVVEKTEGVIRVREEVRAVLATQLPSLIRRLEELQRNYMWDFVNSHWKDFPEPEDQADVAYLVARRLAISLEAEAGRLATSVPGGCESPVAFGKAHPMIMYVVPSVGPHPRAGDIISESADGHDTYWLILTPSCDFAQSKAEFFTLARCDRLSEREEFKKWVSKKDAKTIERLAKLIEDRGGDRWKFLPRAFFIPDLVVDFQRLRSVEVALMGGFKQVATLDSPFAEAAVARFFRYFSRLGTPDIDRGVVMKRLEATLAQVTQLNRGDSPAVG